MNIKESIKNFDESNLTSAIMNCYEKPNYRVLVVAPKCITPTNLTVFDCVKALYSHERDKFKIESIITENDSIAFPNQSFIMTISQNCTARYYRIHEVLLNDTPNEVFLQMLYAKIVDYDEEQELFKKFFQNP